MGKFHRCYTGMPTPFIGLIASKISAMDLQITEATNLEQRLRMLQTIHSLGINCSRLRLFSRSRGNINYL